MSAKEEGMFPPATESKDTARKDPKPWKPGRYCPACTWSGNIKRGNVLKCPDCGNPDICSEAEH